MTLTECATTSCSSRAIRALLRDGELTFPIGPLETLPQLPRAPDTPAEEGAGQPHDADRDRRGREVADVPLRIVQRQNERDEDTQHEPCPCCSTLGKIRQPPNGEQRVQRAQRVLRELAGEDRQDRRSAEHERRGGGRIASPEQQRQGEHRRHDRQQDPRPGRVREPNLELAADQQQNDQQVADMALQRATPPG